MKIKKNNLFNLIDNFFDNNCKIKNYQNNIKIKDGKLILGFVSTDDLDLSLFGCEIFKRTYELNGIKSEILDLSYYYSGFQNSINEQNIYLNKRNNYVISNKIKYPNEFYRSLEFSSFLQEKRNNCQLLVSFPPLRENDDILCFNKEIDCVILVVKKEETSRGDCFKAIDKMKNHGIPFYGVMFIK